MLRMTLDEIAAIDGEVLTPAQVASVMEVDQETIRGQARSNPQLLGFPAMVAGNRVKIPKRPFLAFMGK